MENGSRRGHTRASISCGMHRHSIKSGHTKIPMPFMQWTLCCPSWHQRFAWPPSGSWDVATCQQVQILHHHDQVIAAKYSPREQYSVQVWGSHTRRPFTNIPKGVTLSHGKGLLQANHHLFVISSSNSTQIQSVFSDWPVPNTNFFHSCIVFSQHQEFITYATNRTVSAWDTSTHPHLALIQHNANIHSLQNTFFSGWWKLRENQDLKIYTSSL